MLSSRTAANGRDDWALLLFPYNIKAKTKRQHIVDIWGLSEQQLAEDLPLLTDEVLIGIGSGGVGFNNHRWRELAFLILLTVDLKKKSIEDRRKIFSDYDTFINWIETVPPEGRRQFRHMLRFFAFPDKVERMSSNGERRDVLEAFDIAPRKETKKWSDRQLDEALFDLRAKLQAENPSAVLDFYEAPLKEQWRPDSVNNKKMREILKEILEKYPNARLSTSFGGQHEIRGLFEQLKKRISDIEVIKNNPNLLIKYSYGKGNWAETPWLAILNKNETTTTQKGTYVVILFRNDGDGCHLKLGQGVTEIKEEYGAGAATELQERAKQVRALFPEMMNTDFDKYSENISNTPTSLSELYEASTIYSKYYQKNVIPSDEELEEDISTLLNCYEKYVLNKRVSPVETDDGRKIWAVSAGENGRLWNEFLEEGIIAIGWDQLGDLSQYDNQEAITNKLLENKVATDPFPRNDSLGCYQFAQEMKVDDLVLAKIGRKKVLGGGVVTSDYIFDSSRKEYKSVRRVHWLTKEKNEFPGSGVTTKTLTEISRYPEFKEFAESYIVDKPIIVKSISEPFTYEDALKDLFLDKDELEKIINTAKRKKNIILQGPPGVGKTFVSKPLAYLLAGEKDLSRVEFIQFHQSYSYEDFVQGWRPNSNGGFSLKNGSFYDFCEKARSDSSRRYVFIIDEINRGNLSKIFGELMMLIESDKRGLNNAIKLTYSESEADRFSVPENVFLIGLMNTADRSLALVDYALRRRFAFFYLRPQFESIKFEGVIRAFGGSTALVQKIRERIKLLNQFIGGQRRDLGPGFEVGHSYFCPTTQISSEKDWYEGIINTEIKPLIEEYWFDDPERVDSLVEDLLK